MKISPGHWNSILLTAQSDSRSDFSLCMDGRDVPVVVLRHPRARRLRLRYDPRTLALRLTMPPRGNLRAAQRWVREQAGWIREQLAKAITQTAVGAGTSLPFDDTHLLIDWRPDAARAPQRVDDKLVVGGPHDAVARRVQRWLVSEARDRLTPATEVLAASADLRLTGVSVGDPRSRWGSCSSAGRIRYSWRLVMAPTFVMDSVVAHEVAHLAHLDHSPRFHRLAEALLGTDPAPARDWLRRHGATLQHWDFG